jgi:hypothetical protein
VARNRARLRWEQRRCDLANEIGLKAAQALDKVGEALEQGKLRDAQAGATTLGILIDKAQLLSGGSTGRSEHTHTNSELDAEIRRLVEQL